MNFSLAAILVAAMAHGDTHGRKQGNPDDLEAYIARMEEPERAQWQKPDEVLSALQMKPGQVACDIGAGPGYFSLRLARAGGGPGAGLRRGRGAAHPRSAAQADRIGRGEERHAGAVVARRPPPAARRVRLDLD